MFFERLVRLAQVRMRAVDRRVVDAEDIALSAFASFCRGAENQRFTQLLDRHGLWRLLVSITIHKLSHLRRDQDRLKRGGDFNQIENRGDSDDGPSVVDQIISREPTPEFAAQVAEQYDRWMKALNSEELTRLAVWPSGSSKASPTTRSPRSVDARTHRRTQTESDPQDSGSRDVAGRFSDRCRCSRLAAC